MASQGGQDLLNRRDDFFCGLGHAAPGNLELIDRPVYILLDGRADGASAARIVVGQLGI